MNGMRFIDTNILVYAYDSSDPKKQTISQELIKTNMREETGCISAQVLGEFFVVVTRKIKNPFTIEEALHLLKLFTFFRVAAVDDLLVERAIGTMREYDISYWDALIISAAEFMKCSTIITEDLNHKQAYNGVEAVNPFM
ncbi:MAG: PIN domain-containing protein [candidate division Zixibacteria bacterium]|nr:PIN domain-containing protein [candidate division Zixibacteria bacterium]